MEELGWNHGLEGHQQAQFYAPAPLINPAVDPDSGSEKEDLSALLPKRTVRDLPLGRAPLPLWGTPPPPRRCCIYVWWV
jgi:hypothetical protein